jgi:hypothetical protein
MPATPKYGLRYPLETDPADVPVDLQKLATDAEAALTPVDTRTVMPLPPTAIAPGAQAGYVLQTLAGAPLTVGWQSAGAFGLIVPIGAEVVLAAAAAQIEWTSIPATYKHLLIEAYLRTDRATNQDTAVLQCNGDTGSNYRTAQAIVTEVTSGSPGVLTSATALACQVPGANATPAGEMMAVEYMLRYYTLGSSKYVAVFAVGQPGAGGSMAKASNVGAGSWTGAAAINRVTLKPGTSGNFIAGCRAQLYGITA